MKGANARERVRPGGPRLAQQRFRALLLHSQIRFGGQRLDERGTIALGRHDEKVGATGYHLTRRSPVGSARV
ncbi:MAG: hypothetical protein DMF86_03610 [Acidobacteria bacterium]|nr:MAG: hypothetical protein DMF86_03610 [Acidobacteriota bacterium]